MTPTTTEPRVSGADRALLSILAEGHTAEAAARRLDVSTRTLRRRLRAICDEVGVDTSIEVVVWAARRDLI